MTEADGTQAAPSRPRVLRWALLLLLVAGASAAVVAFVHLSRRLTEARAAGATLAGRLHLVERGSAAAEALRGDLESALELLKDDERGRAWLSRCAFPVDSTPAGGASLPRDGRATVLLLARPGLFQDVSRDEPAAIPTVRMIAWFPAESPESPALVSWESEPLVSAQWLASLGGEARRESVETLVRGGVRFAWSPGAAGPQTLDLLAGDVVAEEATFVSLRGTVRRWCGDAPGAPVLSRGLGYPAFYVAFLGARRMEVHLTMEVKVEGQAALRREVVAVATGP